MNQDYQYSSLIGVIMIMCTSDACNLWNAVAKKLALIIIADTIE